MRHQMTRRMLVVASAFFIQACGSNAGPPQASCSVATLPNPGMINLTGAVTQSLSCNIGYATYNQTTTTFSFAVHNPQGSSVLVAGVDLEFSGKPNAGNPSAQNKVTESLVSGGGGPGPNNVTIILNGAGDPTYYVSAPNGQMALTLTSAEEATDQGNSGGSASDLWCIHGEVTADVPNLSPGPASQVHLDATF